MKYNGRLTVCDRCGAKVFSKSIGEGETDGGYTRWNKFEELPNGWCVEDVGNLCPDCAELYEQLRNEFLHGNEFLRNGLLHGNEIELEVIEE